MSTFAEKDFDSNNYDENRPRYPESLYKAIFQYHKGSDRKLAVDIGCGPGTASFSLLKYVDKVIATDPSDVMMSTGIKRISKDLAGRIEFKVSSAEDLSGVISDDKSVDIVTCAEAIHWVNHDAFFSEAARVLKSGGTLAYWGYIEPRFIDYPEANEIYEKYVFEDKRYMGPCWKPGKQFLRYFFKDLHVPTAEFTDIEKHDYYPGETKEHTAYYLSDYEYTMKKLGHYLSSWSALHDWKKQNPNAEKSADELMIDELKEKMGWNDDTKLRVEWGTTYVLARKR